MELSNLLGNLGHKEEESEKFLALELTDDIVQAAVWHVAKDVTEVVTIGTPIPWNGDTGNLDALITAVDTTITKASENLSSTPIQVIFGIPTTWLDGDAVKTEKKVFIKKIYTELELKPLGFVVIMDSLIRFLRMQEGTPTTAILIQVADTELTIAAVGSGKTHAITNVPRTDDVAKDVESGIKHCVRGLTQLPSRFIVFDGMHDLEDVVQNLTLVEWTAKFPFLHIPKIESLSKDVVIRALCVAGGSEVAKSIGFTIRETPVEEPTLSTPSAVDLEALGFTTEDESPSEILNEPQELPVVVPRKFSLPHITIPKLIIPKLSLPFSVGHIPIRAIIAFVVVAFVFFLLAGSLWLFPHATVTISVTPKTESTQFTLNLDPAATTIDPITFTVPVEKVSTNVSGEASAETSGTKQIGDSSTGEITLYNRTLLKKTFTKGTLLTSGSIKFTLDEDVNVASKSAGSDYVDVPGKAVAKITANNIGDTGNIQSGNEFVIGNFSKDSFVGKNESALKGGSSKSVSAVSAKDKIALVKELKTKLENDAKGQLQSGGGLVYILPNSVEVTSEEYSAKVGDDASTLTAKLTVTVQGYSLSQSDVVGLSRQVLVQKLSGFELISEPVVEIGEGDAKSVNVKATAKALPQLNKSSLIATLQGIKDEKAIEQMVGVVPGFVGVKVTITPTWLPPRFKTLPRKAENIILNLAVAQ
ncbi:MAG: hypothetical protein WCL07_00535 [bacterium]